MKKMMICLLTFLLLNVVLCIAFAEIDTTGNYEYACNSNGTVSITKYLGNEENVMIPEILDGHEVVAIGSKAFSYCSAATIRIPSSVTEIGKFAFLGCSNLFYVEIHGDIQNYDGWLNRSITYAVNRGAQIEKVYNDGNIRNLQYVYLDENIGVINLNDYSYFLISDDTVMINGYDGKETDLYIPASISGHKVTTIGKNAFDSLNLTSVSIPDTVLEIRSEAFAYNNLTSVIIPNGVLKIGEAAFAFNNLTSVTIPDSVIEMDFSSFYTNGLNKEFIVSANNPKYEAIDGVLFDKATNALVRYPEGREDELYEIPDGIYSIGFGAFAYSNLLKSIVVSEGVMGIGESAFYGCESLMSVSIPESVTMIGDEAFYDCPSLTEVTICSTSIGNYLDFVFENGDNIVFIVQRCSEVAESCERYRCVYLDEIETDLKSMDYVYVLSDDWTAIIESYHGSETNLTIPNSLDEHQVTGIADWAFSGNSLLTSVEIPEGVTSIGNWAFAYCPSLTSIVIPESVASIGEGALNSCESLSSITIPESVTSIGNYAFVNNPALTKLAIFASIPNLDLSAIVSNPADIIFTVREGSELDLYCIEAGFERNYGDAVAIEEYINSEFAVIYYNENGEEFFPKILDDYSNDDISLEITYDEALFAQKFQWDTEGFTEDEMVNQLRVLCKKGDLIPTYPVPEKYGYLGKWVLGEKTDAGLIKISDEVPTIMGDEDVVLIPEYTIGSYTLKIVNNGVPAEGVKNEEDNVIFEITGEYCSLIEYPDNILPEMDEYYVFYSIYRDAESEGMIYNCGLPSTMPANNTTLFINYVHGYFIEYYITNDKGEKQEIYPHLRKELYHQVIDLYSQGNNSITLDDSVISTVVDEMYNAYVVAYIENNMQDYMRQFVLYGSDTGEFYAPDGFKWDLWDVEVPQCGDGMRFRLQAIPIDS